MCERSRCRTSRNSHPARRERGVERRQTARRAAVEEREAVVGVDEVRADPARVAAVEQVEWFRAHARTLSRASRRGGLAPIVTLERSGDDFRAARQSSVRTPTDKGGWNARSNACRRRPVLDRPVQLGHRQGHCVLRTALRVEGRGAAPGVRRLLHLYEGREAHRWVHGERRRGRLPRRVGHPPDDRRRRRDRRGRSGRRWLGRDGADGRGRERKLSDDP